MRARPLAHETQIKDDSDQPGRAHCASASRGAEPGARSICRPEQHAAAGNRDFLIRSFFRTILVRRIEFDPRFGLRGRLKRPDVMGQSVDSNYFYEDLIGHLSEIVCCCHDHGPQPAHGQYQWEQLDFKVFNAAGKCAM